MRLGHIELPVSDPMRSLAFYRDILGFELEVNQSDRFIWMTASGATLMLRPGFESAPENDRAGFNLVLYTSNLEADAERLRQAGLTFSERANCLHFRDPDGHHLQLVDPGDEHCDDAGSGECPADA